MNIEYKCKREVMPTVWHHNLIIDEQKMVYKEHSEVPSSSQAIIDQIKDGIIAPSDGWIVDC